MVGAGVIMASKSSRQNLFETAQKLCSAVFILSALVISLTVWLPQSCYAAGGDYVWVGGPYNVAVAGKQEARASVVDSQGNLIIVGTAATNGTDFHVVKINAEGTGTHWSISKDGTGGIDVATAVAVDSDDNVFVTGYLWNGATYNDIYTAKYAAADGALLWEHTFDGTGNGQDYPTSIAVDNVGSVYVGGYMQRPSTLDSFILLKYGPDGTNLEGNPLWNISYDGGDSGNHRIYAVVADDVKGVAVTGESETSPLDFDCLTIKYDNEGTQLWDRNYPDTGNGRGQALAMDTVGNVIMAGYVYGLGGTQDFYVHEYLSANGNTNWVDAHDSTYEDHAEAIWLDSDDSVYVVGSTASLATGNDLHVRAYQDDGTDIWSDSYDTGSGHNDMGFTIVGDNDGELFVAGYKNDGAGFDDLLTLKLKRDNGNQLWLKTYDAAAKLEAVVGAGLTTTGDLLVGATSDRWTAGSTDYDFLAIKYKSGALNAPSSLTATLVSNTQVDLSWADNSSGEDNFILERKIGVEGTPTEIVIGANQISYSDSGLTADSRYYYRIKAKNAATGDTPYSNEVNVKTTVVSEASPVFEFQHGSPGNGEDLSVSIAIGPDNHPVITGHADDGISFNYHTIKLDRSNLNELWTTEYDSDDLDADVAADITVDSNNRVSVTGSSFRYDGGGKPNSNDIYTVGYPADGSVELWAGPYNGPDFGEDFASAIASADDGSDEVVVVGYARSSGSIEDIYVLKYLPDGTLDWVSAPYDVLNNDQPMDVAFDAAGDILVGGYTLASGNEDYLLVKYHGGDGSLDWDIPFNGAGNGEDKIVALVVDAAGDVYVTGSSVNAAANKDIYTIKYSGVDGTKLWEDGQNGTGHGDDVPVGIAIDPVNGDILVAATTVDVGGDSEYFLIRYDSAGNIISGWPKVLDRPGSHEDLYAMTVDPSGVACLTGTTDASGNDNVLTVKYDADGIIIGASVYNGADNQNDTPTAIASNQYGETFVAGMTVTSAGDSDFMVFLADGAVMQSPTPFTTTQLYTNVALSWADNSHDETGFRIERKIGSCDSNHPWDSIHTANPGETSYTNSALSIGSTFCYRIQSFSASDESRWVERQVTTAEPVAPSGLSATVQNTTDILLEWTDNTGDEDGFTLERCQGGGCSSFSALPVSIPANATSYIDDSACNGQTYSYRIKAYKTNEWPTGYSNTTADHMTDIPVDPTDLMTDWVSEAWVELKWTDSNADETEFRIERCLGDNCSPVSTIDSVLSPAGNKLHYRMDEASWDGTVAEVVDLSVAGNPGQSFNGATTTAGKYDRAGSFDGINNYVATPLVLDQSATTNGATMAAWIYPDSISVNDHFVFGTDNGGNDWSLLRNAGFWYVANGSDAGLVNTGIAIDVGVWQHMAIVFNPASGVTLYKDGSSVWSNAAIDFDDSTAALHLGRRGSLNQDFFDGRLDEVSIFDQPLALTEIQALHEHGLARFNDTTVVVGATYNYQVKAYKDASCAWPELPSNQIQVVAGPPAPSDLMASVVDSGKVKLTWTDNTTTETGFRIERCEGAACTVFSEVGTIDVVDATSYVDASVCADPAVAVTYKYRVFAIKGAAGADWVSPESTVAVTAIPALLAPTALNITSVSEDTVNMLWDYPSSDLTGFRLYTCSNVPGSCTTPGDYGAATEISPFPAGTQLMLHLDEDGWSNAVGEVIDVSGSGNNGTGHSDVTTIAAGKYGRAGWFDGVNDYISTELNLDQSATSPGATFEAWIYPTINSSAYKYVISTENGGYDWGLYLRYNTWYIADGNSRIYTGIIPAFDTWQHVTLTFDPTNGINLYVNGVNVWSTYTIYTEPGTTANVTIGRQGNYSSYFPGGIDEVAVYDRPLDTTEVLDRYQRKIRYSESGLIHASPYSLRVAAYKTPGCSWESNYAQVDTTTAGLPTPDGLEVVDISSTHIDLAWNDNATSETAYHLQWCQEGVDCPLDEVVPANNTSITPLFSADTISFSDVNVCPGETYSYQLRAEKSTVPAWETDWLSVQAVTPAATPPANFVADPATLTESTIDLGWDDMTVDEDEFVLERCEGTDFLCGSPTLVTAIPGTVLGSLLHYRMDEALWNNSVDEVDDLSGQDNHGRAYNGAVTDAAGRFDRGGYFDGLNDYVLTPLSLDQSPSGQGATFEAWVKPTVTDTKYRHIFSTDDGGYDWGLYHRNGTWWLSTGENWRDTGIAVDVDEWQHVAVVFSPGNVATKFYKNGVATTMNASYLGYDDSSKPVFLGRRANSSSSSYYYAGYMDEVAIYNRPLTQAEIDQHHQTQIETYGFTDTGLLPGTTYTYQIKATKSAVCGWEATTTLTVATADPPPPTGLSVSKEGTAVINLSWDDNSGSETGYRVQRCDGICTAAGPFDDLDILLAENTTSYIDGSATVCPGNSYTYQVRAEKNNGPNWETAWTAPESDTTEVLAPPTVLTASRVSEVQIDLEWVDNSSDETGFSIERCLVADCSTVEKTVVTAADATTFADNQLATNQTYYYRVQAVNPGACNWPTAYTNIDSATTTTAAPDSLQIDDVKEAQIDLSWTDTSGSGTSILVERCAGSGCGDFVQIAEVGATLSSYSDTTVCPATTYSYRLKAKGNGLEGEGNWTRRMTLTFTAFRPETIARITIPHTAGMQPDFDDIRFYDEDVHQQLVYYIESITAGVSANFLVFTGRNENISVYYGNTEATEIGDPTPMTIFHDDFSGTVIDAAKWLTVDVDDTIVQDDGLVLKDLFNWANRRSYQWEMGLISAATFDRVANRELTYSLTIPADTVYYNEFTAGWEEDQTTNNSFENQLHGLHWYEYSFRTYEKTVATGGSGSYAANNSYKARIVLKDIGAKYYVVGGAYANWTLVWETSTNDDTPMRIGIKQHNHQATIHEVRVMDVILDMGVSFGTEGTSAAYTFGNTWTGTSYSNIVTTLTPTPSPLAPSGLNVTAVSDSEFDLSWSDNSFGETGFEIWRCSGASCTFTRVDTTGSNATSYTDTTAPASTESTFKIRAVKSDVCIWATILDSETVSDTSFAARTSTDSLTATGENSQVIRLDWTDVATDEDGYEVEVLTPFGEYVKIADLPADSNVYFDTMSLEKNTDYYYRVRPYRGTDFSPYSNLAMGTTLDYDASDTTCY